VDIGGTVYGIPACDFEGDMRPDGIYNLVDIGADENDNVGVDIPSNDEDHLNSKITIYPNPCNEIAYISAEGLYNHPYCVGLYSTDGSLIKSTSVRSFHSQFGKIRLDVSEIPSGSYVISIENGKVRYSQKVLIIH
jgi:hypothetical protein